MDYERWLEFLKKITRCFRTAKIVINRSWNQNLGCAARAKFVRNCTSQEASTSSQQDALLTPVNIQRRLLLTLDPI